MAACDTPGRTLELDRSAPGREAVRVRHVDELSDDAERRFYERLEGEDVDGAGFVDGELIVFTDYYRVELA